MMRRLLLAGFLALLSAPAFADSTIDALSAGSALGGTEKIPMFQTANPAVVTTPSAIKTYITGSVVNFSAGTVGAPSVTFGGDTTTGIFRPGANQLEYAVSGARSLLFGLSFIQGDGSNPVLTLLSSVGTTLAYAGQQVFMDGANVYIKVNSSVTATFQSYGIRPAPVTVSALASCASGTEGTIASVTDSNTITWGATIAGSSSNHVLAYCDGTNWTVAGK